MSQELVPQSYGRNAYNLIHGANLESYTSHLTAEKAEQIKRSVDIEAYVGTHGITQPTEQLKRHFSPEFVAELAPTEVEYEAVKSVVDQMQPSDTLLIEVAGFPQAAKEPAPAIEAPSFSSMSGMDMSSLFQGMLSANIESQKSQAYEFLAKQREARSMGAWEYAARLAYLKGIKVVYADIDAYEQEAVLASSPYDALGGREETNEAKDAFLERVDRRRERLACNAVKDIALQMAENQTASGDSAARKPKVVVFFGASHKEGLEEAFKDLGLEAKMSVLDSTSHLERLDRSEAAARAREKKEKAERMGAKALHLAKTSRE